jgi:ketosteroid isomerase-like protein
VTPEESTTPDLVELVGQSVEAGSRRDMDGIMALYAADAVWDMSPLGMGTFMGRTAARGFFEDWFASYEEYGMEAEEILDLGNGVAFAVILQKGRPVGSTGHVELRYASVTVWEERTMVRVTNYSAIDEARAAGERLAQERG